MVNVTEVKLSLGYSLVFYILITSFISFLLGLNIGKQRTFKTKVKVKKANSKTMYLDYVKQIPKANNRNVKDRKKCETILKQFKVSNCKYAEVKYLYNEYKTSDSLASALFRINKDLKFDNIKIIRRLNKVFLVNTEVGETNGMETQTTL